MIQQKGCISEKLLRSREAHEFISYSEWESETDVQMYVHSHAHEEIVKHTRDLKDANAVVKLYEAANYWALVTRNFRCRWNRELSASSRAKGARKSSAKGNATDRSLLSLPALTK
jgi:heme-degrading monooxygenase HmoA